MNDNERDRIAAALHQARPDWPVKQLKTLLTSPQLCDRPRRDVFVALAWVACESNTASPYRVLETGPWWRAAAVDSTGTRLMNTAEPHERCRYCDHLETDCRRMWASDHDYEPRRPLRRSPDAIRTIVEEAKSRLEPTNQPTPPRETVADPRADKARAILRGGDE